MAEFQVVLSARLATVEMTDGLLGRLLDAAEEVDAAVAVVDPRTIEVSFGWSDRGLSAGYAGGIPQATTRALAIGRRLFAKTLNRSVASVGPGQIDAWGLSIERTDEAAA